MREQVLTTADGHPLRVHDAQNGARRVMLIVPPLATKPSLLAAAVDVLSHRFHVVTWEPRLILERQVPMRGSDELSVAAHCDDVERILAHFGAGRVFLLGYCSGAALALHLAARNPRIDRVALVHGAYFLQPEACEVTQYERDVLALVPQIARDPATAGVLFDAFFRDGKLKRREHEFADEAYRPYADVTTFHRFGVGLRALIDTDARAVARQLSQETLVCTSLRDDQTHPASSRLIASLIDADLDLADNGDHYELCRAQPRLMDRILRFAEAA